MSQEVADSRPTLALNTILEHEFVTPLSSIRGALENLRDFPDMSPEDQERFLHNALQDCARLESGIEHLASTVYTGSEDDSGEASEEEVTVAEPGHTDRIHFLTESRIVEVDFSDFVFSSSSIVNEFYDQLDRMIEATGQRWYIVVNYRHCRIWPEAWVAFAHRGQKVNVSYSLGTVRYIEEDELGVGPDETMLKDPDLVASRELAFARIEELRQAEPREF